MLINAYFVKFKKQNKSKAVVWAFNLSTQEAVAELRPLSSRPVWSMSQFQDSQGCYTEKPCLKKERKDKDERKPWKF